MLTKTKRNLIMKYWAETITRGSLLDSVTDADSQMIPFSYHRDSWLFLRCSSKVIIWLMTYDENAHLSLVEPSQPNTFNFLQQTPVHLPLW